MAAVHLVFLDGKTVEIACLTGLFFSAFKISNRKKINCMFPFINVFSIKTSSFSTRINWHFLRYIVRSKQRITMKNLILLTPLLGIFSLYGQENTIIKAGEKLTYSASYNMSGLMTEIAQVNMETQEVKTSKNTLLHLKCKAATYSKWDGFFKIRDLYESYVNPKNLKPVLHKRDIYEGGYIKKMKYVFNYAKKSVNSTLTKKNNIPRNKTLAIKYNTHDAVATLYQVRNLDLQKINVGEMRNFSILFDEKEIPISLTYLGKETIHTPALGKKECYKMAVSAKTDALRGAHQNLVWLTADAKKIPVLIKFHIPVGTGQLKLTAAQGI